MTQLHRCTWAENHPLNIAYHDAEWGVPVRDSEALFAKLMLDGFQAGLSWLTVLKKRDAFRAAFKDFNPKKVARFTEKDINRLLGDASIIRSRAKIEATIGNARAYLAMQKAGEEFSEFVWAFTGGKTIHNRTDKIPAQTPLSLELSNALKNRGFKFVGPTIVYAWMQAVGMVNDHGLKCFRYREIKGG